MLEQSSELALVQSLYANNMRCPPSAPGISVRSEDLPLRYVVLAPPPNPGYLLWTHLDCVFVWAEPSNVMWRFPFQGSKRTLFPPWDT